MIGRVASATELQHVADAPFGRPLAPAVSILSSAQFINGFVPPDYLVDRILQRGFIYSNTGATGAGKTAVALLLAHCVDVGKNLGDYEVTRGRVLIAAGENPDDTRMRWISMGAVQGFDPRRSNVHFIDRVLKFSETLTSIGERVEAIGGVDLVLVDTSAAYYEGADENDNVQMGAHARRLRTLTTLPGNPTVVVNCHPTKNASADNLLPRGGGAFIAEMDGNLTSTKRDNLVELHWQGKFRGPDFSAITFKLETVKTDRLVDSRGRPIASVVALPVSDAEQAAIAQDARRDEDVLLTTMLANDGASLTHLATAASWFLNSGQPYKSRVNRTLSKLKAERFVALERGTWHLTDKGEKEARKIEGHNAV